MNQLPAIIVRLEKSTKSTIVLLEETNDMHTIYDHDYIYFIG